MHVAAQTIVSSLQPVTSDYLHDIETVAAEVANDNTTMAPYHLLCYPPLPTLYHHLLIYKDMLNIT